MSKGYLESFVGIIFVFLILVGIMILFEWKGKGDDARAFVHDGRLKDELVGHSSYLLLPLLAQEREGMTVLDRLVAAGQNGVLSEEVSQINDELRTSKIAEGVSITVSYSPIVDAGYDAQKSYRTTSLGSENAGMIAMEELDVPVGTGVLHIAAVTSSVYPEGAGGI